MLETVTRTRGHLTEDGLPDDVESDTGGRSEFRLSHIALQIRHLLATDKSPETNRSEQIPFKNNKHFHFKSWEQVDACNSHVHVAMVILWLRRITE